MIMTRFDSPVIVIGMHRSGTSMLSRHLGMLGINMGRRVDENEESRTTKRINQFIFRQVNASWDYVSPFTYLYSSEEHMNTIEQIVRSFIGKRFYIIHAGLYQSLAPVSHERTRWGWKDPRNTFTIIFWKKIFPKAKIVHIYRNPFDVSLSLVAREREYGVSIQNNFKTSLIMMLRHGGLGLSNVNILNTDNCFSLWEQYVLQAMFVEQIYQGECLSICYEDYVSNPECSLNKLIKYLEINPPDDALSLIIAQINPNNCYKYTNSDEGMKLYHKNKNNALFRRLGYPARIDHDI